jgi:tripartite-type tricarboxylate transporter receptor subunit TctC
MQPNRRDILKIGVIAFGSGMSPNLLAQAPPVRLVVPFPPGAANDTIARLLADAIEKRTRKSWIVDNKAGAGSQIGIDFVAKAAPDGSHLLFGAADGLAVLPAVKASVPYDPGRDFAYIARIATSPFALVVSSRFGARNYAEFISMAKKDPGSIRVAITGVGSLSHMGTALIASAAGVELTSVPYKGMSPAVNDLVAGHVEALLVSPTTIAPHVASGKARALVVLDQRRSAVLPNVPSAADLGMTDVDVVAWWGILAPARTPAASLSALRSDMADVLGDAEFRKAMGERGFELAPLDADAFSRFAAGELQRWRTVARKANITLVD